MERIYIRVAVILALTAGDGFSRPGVDAAEFQNVGVAQLGQLFGGLLAPVAAAAVDQNPLIFVRQLRDFSTADGLVGNADGPRDVAILKFRLGADIQQQEIPLCVHDLRRLLLADLPVGGFGGLGLIGLSPPAAAGEQQQRRSPRKQFNTFFQW